MASKTELLAVIDSIVISDPLKLRKVLFLTSLIWRVEKRCILHFEYAQKVYDCIFNINKDVEYDILYESHCKPLGEKFTPCECGCNTRSKDRNMALIPSMCSAAPSRIFVRIAKSGKLSYVISMSGDSLDQYLKLSHEELDKLITTSYKSCEDIISSRTHNDDLN